MPKEATVLADCRTQEDAHQVNNVAPNKQMTQDVKMNNSNIKKVMKPARNLFEKFRTPLTKRKRKPRATETHGALSNQSNARTDSQT